MTRFAVLALAGVLVTGAYAASPPVKSETATSGNVRARIVYSIPRGEAYYVVRLIVDRAGKRVLDGRVPPCSAIEYCGTKPEAMHGGKATTVRDLDGDGEPEILLDFYSGAAHCCFWSRFYRWDDTTRRYVTLAHLWGNIPRYRFVDLDGDRHREFVSADDRFGYAFTSFAGSTFPLRICTYRAGRLVDTTRAYPALIARDAATQWRWYRDARRTRGEVFGPLAAWAADQSLLGRGEAAFAQLRRLSRAGALDDQAWGSAAEYLRQLRMFLRRTGHLV